MIELVEGVDDCHIEFGLVMEPNWGQSAIDEATPTPLPLPPTLVQGRPFEIVVEEGISSHRIGEGRILVQVLLWVVEVVISRRAPHRR